MRRRNRAVVQNNFPALAHADSGSALRHKRLSLVNPKARRSGIGPVDARLLDLQTGAVKQDGNGIFFAEFRHLHQRRAFQHFYLRIAQIGGKHANRAVLAHAQKCARGQQQFRPSIGCTKFLVGQQAGKL